MAVPARNLPERSRKGQFMQTPLVIEPGEFEDVAAQLYGMGFKRAQIARKFAPLFPSYQAARRRLAKLEKRQEFRDLIYKYAVQKLDLQTPAILEGVGRAAKRGRVDAAKLALAVTERHTDKSDGPQHVLIELKGLDRPYHRQLNGPSEGEGN
jgi:hypothetical protein